MNSDDSEVSASSHSELPRQGLYDPHDAPEDSRWYPNTSASVQLALCLESCKQINEFRSVLGKGKVSPRRLTLLATPTVNLVKHVLAIAEELERADRSHWPERDRRSF